MMSVFYATLLPAVLPVVGVFLTYLLNGVAGTIKDRWGIEIEASHREALHSALMTGIRAALARGLKGDEAIEAAVGYSLKSVPDAIQILGPTAEVLTSLAASKLREALGQ